MTIANPMTYKIIARLEEGLAELPAEADPPLPYHYLDPEALGRLWSQLTGLAQTPRLFFDQQNRLTRVGLAGEGGVRPAPELLCQALVQALGPRLPRPDGADALSDLAPGLAWLEGRLASTRFPDGGPNLELDTGWVRGLLFFRRRFFSPMLRPLLGPVRFHAIRHHCRALVYVENPAATHIFYHPSCGDNKQHLWAPLTPLAIWAAPEPPGAR